MKHDIPAPTGAIDWASETHVGAVVDGHGDLVARYDFAHTAAGLAAMLRRFARHGVEAVAIERPDGPVVETLLAADLKVFVISPRQLKNLVAATGPPATKTTRSMRSCLPMCCAPTGVASTLCNPTPIEPARCVP